MTWAVFLLFLVLLLPAVLLEKSQGQDEHQEEAVQSMSNIYYNYKIIILFFRVHQRHGTLNSSTRRRTLERKPSKEDLKPRPSWALFARVNEGSETILFREKFADWPEPGRIIKMKGHESSGEVIKVLYMYIHTYVQMYMYVHVHL